MFFSEEEKYNLVTTPQRNADGSPTGLMKMNSMIFFTFIIMNMCNQVNCRVGDYMQMKFFNFLANNLIFWVIIVFEVGVTHLMLVFATTQFGSKITGLTEITTLQYILAWSFGILTIPLYIVSNKFLKDDLFLIFMEKFDLEQEDVVPDRIKKIQNLLVSSTHVQGTELESAPATGGHHDPAADDVVNLD